MILEITQNDLDLSKLLRAYTSKNDLNIKYFDYYVNPLALIISRNIKSKILTSCDIVYDITGRYKLTVVKFLNSEDRYLSSYKGKVEINLEEIKENIKKYARRNQRNVL